MRKISIKIMISIICCFLAIILMFSILGTIETSSIVKKAKKELILSTESKAAEFNEILKEI